jgi:3-isopropylmalate dehydratase
MLPIVLPREQLELLHADAKAGLELTVDLERKVIVRPQGKGEDITFDVDDFRRHCLINGLDDIGRKYSTIASRLSRYDR